MLSTGIQHRRHRFKAVCQAMADYDLYPLDVLNHGVPYPIDPALSAASELMRKAHGYLAIIDTQFIMTSVRSINQSISNVIISLDVTNRP